MNSSTGAKQPKKKRRVDDNDPVPGPSSEVLPLIAPQLVKKSSKDPNRGMYPHPKNKSVGNHGPISEFIKASDLYKYPELSPKPTELRKPPSESALSDTTCKTNDDFVHIRKKLISRHCDFKSKQSRKTMSSHTNSTNRITKYFKTSSSYILPKVKHVKTSKPEISDWETKDGEIVKCLANNERFFKTYGDCYGLLEDKTNDNEENFINNLPLQIVETILCQIPVLDLMACRLVCSRWKDIIDNEMFMEWKILYHKYKKESGSSETIVQTQIHSLVRSLGHRAIDDSIETILKCMGTKFNRRPSSDMYELLMKNPKGQIAHQVMTERFPEWNGKEARVWCQFTIAILICETVRDILDIYLVLFEKDSSCSRPDVTNAMYCIALFLLYFRNMDNINFGLHYKVYYALYFIENYIPNHQKEKLKVIKGLPGQQSIHSYSNSPQDIYLTHEQIRVLNHRFEMNQKIRVIALAGTGKTTTLLHLAQLYPQIKFLNLVFNKSVSEDAKRRFPSNVTCQTAHSLAFATTGKYLRHKLTKKIRSYELIPHLKHNNRNIQVHIYASLVLNTINTFTSSTASQLSLNHVPYRDITNRRLSEENRENILKDACLIWEMMINKNDSSIKITHDIYLKLYHLKKPKLHKYHCILVDEAQDCNPAMLDIVLSQNVPVLLVGDPHQQIYAFRGAQNALNSVAATHTYYLTKSFRFGPEIAYVASCILEGLKKSSRSNTIIGTNQDSFINGKIEGQYAVIARTNVKLFNEAVRMVVQKNLRPNEPNTINAAFAGGIKSYGFDQIVDMCKLREDPSSRERNIKDAFVSRFKSFTDLSNYAKYADDVDLITKIELINQHGGDILNYISLLKEKCSHPIEFANVVFATAHKAKGLEFDTVVLTEDFAINCPFDNLETNSSAIEDINILYVAVTRAKKCLVLPERVAKILLFVHEKFEYPISSKQALGDKTRLTCCQCDAVFTPHTALIMAKHNILLGSGREIVGGPLCMKCGSDPHMRPDVHLNQIIMYLDPTKDNTHHFMNCITGPLPTDPPVIYNNFARFEDAEQVFVINVNIHH